MSGFVRVAHIFKPVQQQASEAADAEAAMAIKAAYEKLQAGASFVEAAEAAGVKPNVLQPFEIVKGQAYKEFEDVAFSLADSTFSQPLRSPAGYHIIMKYGSRPFGQYAEYREAIIKMLEQRGIRNAARRARGAQLVKEMGSHLTPEQALAVEDSLLESKYPDFGNLMTEYHDGLLFFEVCTREIWDKAAKDEKALAKYFKKNKKKYKFDTPRFRGAVQRTGHRPKSHPHQQRDQQDGQVSPAKVQLIQHILHDSFLLFLLMDWLWQFIFLSSRRFPARRTEGIQPQRIGDHANAG
jgi:peptidyl-prolyl cis-trans isomerase SurA